MTNFALAFTGDSVAAVVAALRVHGCICDPPDFELVDGMRVRVFHVLSCPLCPAEYRHAADERETPAA